VTRLLFLLIRKRAPDPTWDYLAVGATAYFSFYVAAGLVNDYFMAPVDVIAWLYLVNVTHRLGRTPMRFAVRVVVVLAAIQNVYAASRFVVHRLNFIDGRAQVTQFILSRAERGGAGRTRLHLPFVQQQYVLYYLSCFLRHKALRIEGDGAGHGAKSIDLVLTSPLEFARGKCVPWNQGHGCFHADAPAPGDLVVILPEDAPSDDQLREQQQRGRLVFHYRSFPTSAGMDAYVFER
jgi:hypothetical protein